MLTNKSKHFLSVIHQEPSLFKAQDVLVQMEGGHESLTMAELSITDHGFCDECADTVQEIAPWCSLDEAKSMCTESETFKSKICEATEFRTGREPATWLTDDQCARTFGNETQHWIESQSTSVKRRFMVATPMAKHRRLPWKAGTLKLEALGHAPLERLEAQAPLEGLERLEVPVVKTESQPKVPVVKTESQPEVPVVKTESRPEVPVVKTESQPETEEEGEVRIASILVEDPLPFYKSSDPEQFGRGSAHGSNSYAAQAQGA